MKWALNAIWWALALLLALAFGTITGIFYSEEKVNALWLVVAAACFYVLAYRFYGAFLAARVVVLDDRRVTPSWRLRDGQNFQPTNKWVLFGHHFAAIARAGPPPGTCPGCPVRVSAWIPLAPDRGCRGWGGA